MTSNNAYIVSAVRTAGGKKNGKLSSWHPADLGAKVLDELAIISNRINQAESNIEFTGKANQALVNAIQARSMLEKFMTGNMFPRAVQGAAGALGGMAFGSNVTSGIVATIFSSLKFNSKDRLKIAGDLFGNVKFRQMIDEVAQTGSVSEETLSSVSKLSCVAILPNTVYSPSRKFESL